MAETQLCGLCTNVEEEMTFEADLFDPNEPQIYILRLKKVLPQHICTICEEQTQAQQNFATQNKENPKSNISKTEKNRQQNSIDSNCELCGKHFTLISSFWSHMQRHKGEKRFKCDICSDSFFLKITLKRHKLRHTREFGCGHCDRRFKQKNYLTHHERVHTEERPYICPTCGKGFFYSRNLKDHIVIHTGVRAYRCEACDVAFTKRENLFRHYHTKKHKENEEKLPTKLTN